jgi:hypothetical protein
MLFSCKSYIRFDLGSPTILPGSVEARAKINVIGLHAPSKSSDCVEPPLGLGAAPPAPPFGAADGASASCGCGRAATTAMKVVKARNFIFSRLSGDLNKQVSEDDNLGICDHERRDPTRENISHLEIRCSSRTNIEF